MFSSVFGKMNWFNIAILSGVASAFSWFVLNNTDAVVFFGVGAAILFVISHICVSNEGKESDLYGRINDETSERHVMNRDMEMKIDTRIDNLWDEVNILRESVDNLSSKRK